MNLPEYKNLKEKGEHFKIVQIDSIEDFNNIFNSHKNSQGIYRGINSSAYKIYTSLQRQHITKEITNYSIEEYISRVRNQPLLKKYFEKFKIPPSKLSIWSYLQHYGAPTPYIDFSTDFSKAIYFAIEKFELKDWEPINDFIDRFSLYFIKESDFDLINIPKVFESFKETKRISSGLGKGYPDYSYDLEIQHLDRLFDINVTDVFLINHDENFVDVYNTYNNIRIVSQDGLFINNTYENIPLEEALKKFFEDATRFQHSPWDEIDTPQAQEINAEYEITLKENRAKQERLKKNIITSFEIKKELIPEIKNLIGLEKKDIYPNQEDLVWELYNGN
ncbi:FRG domain-containing protein [Cellulophaga baltica]|uniref:FRG domain-containing protein n=1 Tax=Cellulophaga baltica TaxID=76594 RepID=UPI0021493B91|nr:FRG domain-containing protein [Cellulophaga baltica]MCR1026648.1 FRG domain-containing protein [Cellulophaga baltica]